MDWRHSWVWERLQKRGAVDGVDGGLLPLLGDAVDAMARCVSSRTLGSAGLTYSGQRSRDKSAAGTIGCQTTAASPSSVPVAKARST